MATSLNRVDPGCLCVKPVRGTKGTPWKYQGRRLLSEAEVHVFCRRAAGDWW